MRALRHGLAVWLFLPSRAFAEVCDKERPDWEPSDGPVGLIGEAWSIATTPLGLIVVVSSLLGLWRGQKLLCGVSAVLCGLVALSVSVDSAAGARLSGFVASDVYLFAVNEGCRSDPILAVLLYAVLMTLCLFSLALRQTRRIE